MTTHQPRNGNQGGRVRYFGQATGGFASRQFQVAHDLADQPYDVAIIGAGVVGCALAYELSQYHLRVLLLDKNHDVGEGTSKGNSAIIHTGFDANPGTLESQMVTSASAIWPELAEKLKVPMLPTGALLLAVDSQQAEQLPAIHEKALANGVEDVSLLTPAEVAQLEPNASQHARGGLLVPRESIIDPFGVVIAYAEVALANGTDIFLGAEVTGLSTDAQGIHQLSIKGLADAHALRSRVVINAAGLWGQALASQYGGAPYTTNPRRGQFLIYDRSSRSLVNRILLPIPTAHTKGMLVSPTIFGNLLAGPTAEDLPTGHNDATETTPEGIEAVRQSAYRLCPALEEQPAVATYAGLRCACEQGSYLLEYNDPRPGIVTLTGMRSTGLTGSISFARLVVQGLADQCGLELRSNAQATDQRPERDWPGWWKPPYRDPDRMAESADYGEIVCYCEGISRGELADTLKGPLGPATLDGLKRRTRAQMGRCQAFQCGAKIARLLAQHAQIPLEEVSKRGPGTEWIAPPQDDSTKCSSSQSPSSPQENQ